MLARDEHARVGALAARLRVHAVAGPLPFRALSCCSSCWLQRRRYSASSNSAAVISGMDISARSTLPS